MEKQSYLKEFARYVVLSILGTLGVSCYILADTFFVSNGVGTNGLTALNLAIPVYNVIHGCGLMLGMGGATKFAICRSGNDQKRIDVIYTNTVYFAVFFSMIFILTGLFGARGLAGILGADAEVIGMTETYLRWLLIFAPAFLMNDIFLCFVRNDGGPQLSMTAMLIGSFSNILLDYIFIFPLKMGIFGAILATGISPVISITIMLSHWIKKKNTFHLIKTKIAADVVTQNLSIGLPSFIAEVSSGIVIITFNGLILGLEGNVGVAAYGVVANIALVVIAVYTGLAQGIQPLISRAYGVGKKAELTNYLRYALITMAVMSAVIYIAIYVFAGPIAAVFNSENNVRLQKIASDGLKIYFLSNVFAGFNIVLATFFTSIEKTIPAQILSLFRGLIFIVPMACFMAFLLGMTGIWLAYPLTECIVAGLGLWVWRFGNRQKRR